MRRRRVRKRREKEFQSKKLIVKSGKRVIKMCNHSRKKKRNILATFFLTKSPKG